MDVEDDVHAQATAAMDALETKWLVDFSKEVDLNEMLKNFYDWGTVDFNATQALDTYERAALQLEQLNGYLRENNDDEMEVRVRNCARIIMESYSALVSVARLAGKTDVAPATLHDMILRFQSRPADTKLQPIQVVINYILVWTQRFDLRHKGDTVYRQIIIGKHSTKAWVPAKDLNGNDVSDLEKLVTFIVKKAHNADVWHHYIRITSSSVQERLRYMDEPEFKVVRTCRSIMSFSDGLYLVLSDTFVPYVDCDKFKLPEDTAACVYHDMPFAPAYIGRTLNEDESLPVGQPIHPLFLPTPCLDTIMTTQNMSVQVQFWLMAFLGRCLYWSNFLESWQVVLFIKGQAGTGKSTLVNLISAMYSTKDISFISNDIQGVFGLETLKENTFCWLAPEVKSDFALDQAQFQSLVSQEIMSIARKNKVAWEGIIRAHGAMACNCLPTRWMDNAGSITRRIMCFNFSERVTKTKTDMLATMRTQELPFILRKISHCYRTAAVQVGNMNIWEYDLPPEIMEQHEALGADMNPLRQFLKEGKGLRFGRDDITNRYYWTDQSKFLDIFKSWREKYGKSKFEVSDDSMLGPLADHGITRVNATFMENGTETSGYVLVGVTTRGSEQNCIDNTYEVIV